MHYEIRGVVLEQHIVCNLYRLGGFAQKERERKKKKKKEKTAWLLNHTVILDKLKRQQLLYLLFLLEIVIA